MKQSVWLRGIVGGLGILGMLLFLTAFAGRGNAGIYMIFGVTICLFAGGCILLLNRQERLLRFLLAQEQGRVPEEKKAGLENEVLQKEIELQLLQGQINPHFLYNTLDSIRSQALKCGQKEIAQMTERLSKYFRYCISRKEHIVEIRSELQNIEDYFFIQKFRFNDRINLKIQVQEDRLTRYYIPKMTLQPLVENAIAHGLEEVERNGTITIHVFEGEERLYLTVSDTGAGMKMEQLMWLNERLKQGLDSRQKKEKKHSGIAITNINKRIRIFFGEEYGLHFRSMEGFGTEVEITLPKIDDFQRAHYDRIAKEV